MKVEKIQGMPGVIRAEKVFAGDKAGRCCGDCRFCREESGEDLRCMRHKIRTGFTCLCGDWLRKTVMEG